MCERLMMGIEYKEFVRSVPISQIMTVEECRSICSNYNVDFYSLSMDEDVNENSAIMSLYPDGRYIDGIQNAGLVQGESRAGHHSLWVRAYYDKLVPPGVFFHEIAHLVEMRCISEDDLVECVNRLKKSCMMSAQIIENDIREAIAVGTCSLVAIKEAREGLVGMEKISGVIEQAVSDSTISPLASEALLYFAPERNDFLTMDLDELKPAIDDYVFSLLGYLSNMPSSGLESRWTNYTVSNFGF
jgi:hypothetical protein